LFVALAWTLAGCGGGGTILLTKNDEVQLGQDAATQFDAEHNVDRTSPMARNLDQIGQRIAAASDPPQYPYTFTLVHEDVVNAFALLGGPVYMYQGLIDALGGDTDQIAWVLAHEVSHIQQQHAAKRVERAVGAELLLEIVLGKKSASLATDIIAGLAFQNYSRDQESTSDRLGVKFAHAAGYDASASINVLRTFQQIQGSDPSDVEVLFNSHPGNDDRIRGVERAMDAYGISGAYYTAGSG